MASQPFTEKIVDGTVEMARGHLYTFLASTLADPSGEPFDVAVDPKRQAVATAAADLLRSEAPEQMELAPIERLPGELDLRAMVQELQVPRQALVTEHQNVFGLLLGKTAPPNETEYCHSRDSFYRAGELADIAGFYRAFGLERDAVRRERADHLSLELEFMAHLIAKEILAENS
ncbi:MAG: molecular chaperone TorD family protein, partial [bacterium]|nr:molecular chaperone TorD family protein [bacterium]